MMNTLENTELINSRNISFKYGLLSGGVMAIILMLFQVTGNDYSPFYKLSKYLVLILAIVVALNIYKNRLTGIPFGKAIGLGTKLSMIAGLILVGTNTLLFFVVPEIAFSKYGLEPSTIGQSLTISGILFFETLVFGSLITFATLQYLKDGGDPTN